MPEFPTPQECREEGHLRRKQLPRQAHGKLKVSRRNPIALLEASVRGRVPSLVAIKYQLMCASPFGFFRGAVPIMAYDLAAQPNTGIVCQLCGDAHVRNLGAFAGVDGRLVFDINDFDESTRGPFEWDLKRLATSLVLAGLEIGSKGSQRGPAVLTFVETYRQTIAMLARMPVIEAARYQVHRLQDVQPVSKVLLKAERATPLHTLESLTIPIEQAKSKQDIGCKDGPGGNAAPRIFRENRPMLTRVTGARARQVLASVEEYRESLLPERRHFLAQYRPIDVAFKVVGTGSVGLRDYVVYCEGNGPGDPLFLQIKEETKSAYEPYLGSIGPHHQGQRVAEGQRAMQLQSDPFLGWTTISDRDYLVRQLSDYKGSLDLNELKGEGLIEYATVCGQLLARGHARSGDARIIAGYIGNGKRFDEAILEFAEGYAAQTQKDFEALLKSKHGVKATSKA